MKYFVIFTIFFVGATLIGAVGILGPFLTYNYCERTARAVPFYIFSIYCLVFGVILILVELRIRFIVKIFLFVASYNHRAIFILFLGTLAMCSFNWEGHQWIGYLIGGFIILIGIIHIVVGCLDSAWVKEQNAKYLPKIEEPAPTSQSNLAPGQNALDSFFGQPTQPQQVASDKYPSLASDSAMMAGNSGGGDPRMAMASQAAQMPETQRLAVAAGTATMQNMFAGQNTQDAAMNAFSNPEVQGFALNAGMAAAQNPVMQQAASAAASSAISNAYDKLFD